MEDSLVHSHGGAVVLVVYRAGLRNYEVLPKGFRPHDIPDL